MTLRVRLYEGLRQVGPARLQRDEAAEADSPDELTETTEQQPAETAQAEQPEPPAPSRIAMLYEQQQEMDTRWRSSWRRDDDG